MSYGTMATAREIETDLGFTSDDIENAQFCQPCEYEGEHCIAVGFCVDCREYLCQRCYDGHLIPSVTRRHVLLDKDNMPGLDVDDDHTTESETNHSCKQHRENNIEYHCPTHSFLGCHLCFFQHQKSCKDAICIQEVCSTTDWSEEVSMYNQKLENIVSKCVKLQKDIKHYLQTVTSNHTDAIIGIREFKQEVIDIVDKLEKELIEKTEKIKKEETDKLSDLSRRVEKLLKDKQKMSAEIELLQNREQTNTLYIELIQTKDKILRQEDQVQTIENHSENEKQFKQFMFLANKELVEFLKHPNALGSLGLKTKILEKMTHVRDINCKSKIDSSDCMITGLVLLSNHKLIATEWKNNNTVKLIDMKQNTMLAGLELSNRAWAICKINETQVAVTLPSGEKIVLLRVDPTLSIDREIKVNGEPRGVDYLDGKLVVSYISIPYKVEIMDMQGTVLNTFDKDSNGQPLFERPYHLAINPDNKLIYVSNSSSDNVVCMQFDGSFKAKYQDKELEFPIQVTFDSSGNLYILGLLSKNIHQITADCKKVKVIKASLDGLNQPWSICYQENEEQFFIGQYGNDIKVYQGFYKYI